MTRPLDTTAERVAADRHGIEVVDCPTCRSGGLDRGITDV